jgi:hypothetical protein
MNNGLAMLKRYRVECDVGAELSVNLDDFDVKAL